MFFRSQIRTITHPQMADPEQKIGNYVILERLAHGGMAQIYKAKTADASGIERLVVIKRILPHISSSPEYVNMLIDEAKIAVHFNHGNIAQIYDLGRVGDDYFIVMEYVDGKTLGQIIREFRERGEALPLDLICYAMMEVCRGLDYMHRKVGFDGKPLGVVHRDISPQNIIVSYSGTVKIIDFGVAKAEGKMIHTESGVLKGKFAYMSPEQADGQPIDQRSDIFSAGVLLWELATQKRLFKRKSNQETVRAVKKAAFKSASKMRADVPGALDNILEKALHKKRPRRYQYASEMADHLERLLMTINPKYRPIHATQFLYTYFGPEADEKGLPPELPELDIPQKPKLVKNRVEDLEEENTEIEKRPALALSGLYKKLGQGAALFFVLSGLAGSAIWFYTSYWTKGFVFVEVTPLTARVFMNDAPLDLVALTKPLRVASKKELNFRFVLEGYVTEVRTLTLDHRQTEKLLVNLKKEIPPFGDVTLESSPVGATVYLNDIEWQQKTPTRIPQLASGKEHKIGLSLTGHVFFEQTLSLTPGESKKIQAALQINYASLQVDSLPRGAAVAIDGQIVGKTPYTFSRAIPGDQLEIGLELAGYQTYSKSYEFAEGEQKKIFVELQTEGPVSP